MAAEVIHDDNVTGAEGGDQELFDVSAEAGAVDRPVDDAGGGDPVAAKAARKVNVRQRPCGSLAIKRLPRGARPWRRVILVLAQVSSMNTSRLGSSRPWYFFHWARRRAMSARSCSLAYRLFFKTDPFAFEKAPHCAVARRRVALSQFGHHCAQGQIRLLGDPR